MADNIMGSLADQSTYDPATGMPYPGNAPDYGDLSQRMTNAQQYLATQSWPAKLAQSIYGGATLPGDVYAGRVDPGSDEAIRRSADLAGVVTGGSYAAPAMKDATGMGIRAYHSSPFDFERFDLSKLRTGEGANMRGAGAYMAENPAVSGQGGQYWRQFQPRFSGTEGMAAAILSANKFNRDAAIAHAQQLVDEGYARGDHLPPDSRVAGVQRGREDTLKLLQSGNPVGPRTYEVKFNTTPERTLNWDKPLAEQSPYIKDIVTRQLGLPPDLYTLPGGGLAPRIGGATGGNLYQHFAETVGKPNTSAMLNEAGIPGIQYSDAGSRRLGTSVSPNDTLVNILDAAGGDRAAALAMTDMRIKNWMDLPEKYRATTSNLPVVRNMLADPNFKDPRTYNYVSFAPHLDLDIMKKYAVPGAVGAGAAGMGALATQDNYQPQ